MKVALISDIHGNVPALLAVLDDVERFGPDHVVVNGDTVSRGPVSSTCLEILSERATAGRYQWHFVRGNHEDYVARHLGRPPDLEDIRFELARLSYWTFRQIGSAWAEQIQAWTLTVELPEGFRATHASMIRNDDGIYVRTPDFMARRKMAPAPSLFATAHTHRPFVRRVDQTLVVNSGSVGVPFDGDVRASYARSWWLNGEWSAEIVRVDYDREQAEREYHESGCLTESGTLTRIIFEEWKRARPTIRTWLRRYLAAVIAGQIEIEVAVDDYLAQIKA